MTATVTFTMMWDLEDVPENEAEKLEAELRNVLEDADGGETALFRSLREKGADFLDCSLSVS